MRQHVRVFFFCCPVSYVFVQELDDSTFLPFVWAFLYLFLPAGNICHFLSTTAPGPSWENMFGLSLRHRGRRGSQFLLPQEHPPLRHLQAESSCGCRLTLVLVAPACSLTTFLQFSSALREPSSRVPFPCAHQCQGPPLRHSPDVQVPLGDIQYRAATARVNWLLAAKVYPWIPGGCFQVTARPLGRITRSLRCTTATMTRERALRDAAQGSFLKF